MFTRVLGSAAIVLLLAGCAGGGDRVLGANWEGSRDTRTFIPERALRAQQDGMVMLGCLAGERATVSNCEVLLETPAGWGFGASALRMQNQLRAKEAYEGGPAGDLSGRGAMVPVVFCLPGEPRVSACQARYVAMIDEFRLHVRQAMQSLRAQDCDAARSSIAKTGSPYLVAYVDEKCAKVERRT